MNIVGSLTGLALVQRDLNKLGQANSNQVEALDMFHRLKLTNSTAEAILLNNLGLIAGDKDDLPKAAELHQEALETGTNAAPNDRAVWLSNLGNVRELQGSLEDAVEYQRQALTLRTNVFPEDHPDVAASLGDLARVLLKNGDPAAAKPLAQWCLEYWQGRDPEDWRTFNAQSLLGGSLLGLTNYAAARPLLFSGYQGMEQREDLIPRAARPRLREAVERLVQFHTATGDPASAENWRNRLP